MRAKYPWAYIAVLAASLAASCTRFTGPEKLEDSWAMHESSHFRIHVRPGSFASQHLARFAEVLEDQYSHTLLRLEARYEGTIAAFLHDTQEGGLDSVRSGTAFPFTDAFRITAFPPLDDNLLHVMNHEANHVIIRNAIGRPGTSFANEGMASAMVSERHLQFGSWDHRWSRQHLAEIPSLIELIDDETWNGLPFEMKYKASSSFLAWLLQDAGPQKLRRIYTVESGRFAQEFAAIYGKTLDAAESSWRAFLLAQTP